MGEVSLENAFRETIVHWTCFRKQADKSAVWTEITSIASGCFSSVWTNTVKIWGEIQLKGGTRVFSNIIVTLSITINERLHVSLSMIKIQKCIYC